ncbi:MAG: hypothetical protein NZ518_05480 [Dehalococcoidia bacterium]|nr:hypothetical protein [Dehalococcoidia bacterium]
MRRVLLAALSATLVVLTACADAPPRRVGGPLGSQTPTTIRTPTPTPNPNRDLTPPGGFQPGQILVQPAPGVTRDDLERQFGAGNVRPYTPSGLDDTMILEFGADNWFQIQVPSGNELGAINGLRDQGRITGYGLLPLPPSEDPRNNF